jgi:hypothetical protein
MFWTALGNVLRVSITMQRTFTAIGAATIIAVGVYDFVKHRNKTRP